MENSYILYDIKLKIIVSVFSSMEKAEKAKLSLIVDDVKRLSEIINNKLLVEKVEDVVADLGLLQMAYYFLVDPSKRLSCLHTDHHVITSRYMIYTKKVDDFELKYKNNTNVIILH
jgi:hypothetical protein